MFEMYTHENGIRTILVPNQDTKAITLLALFRVGSRFEAKRTLGISHFLEHMMFKGTERRPETVEISRELDGVGAEYNAFTDKDHTGYYIKVNYEHAGMAMDIMHDMLANSLLQAEEIEKERNVILEEMNMYEDNPLMLIDELYEEELYKGSSLGWRIIGDAKTLAAIKRPEILAFRKEFYRPSETVFIASGRLPDNLRELIAATFGTAPKRSGRPKQPKPFSAVPAQSRGPRLAMKFRDTTQVQLALGFPAFGMKHADLPALQLLSNILGGTMSSRLFISVREKRGLAYMVRSSVSAHEDTGNLSIQAGLDRERTPEAIKVIMSEIKKVVEKGVSLTELANAKENIRGRMALAFEDSEALADFYGKQALHVGTVLSPDEKFAKILAVTKEDIGRVAKLVCKPSKLAAAIIGPFKDGAPFVKLMKS